MSSKKPSQLDFPASPADVAALRRASAAAALGAGDYLAFLARFPPESTEALRKRKGPRGAPFRL